MTSKGTENDLCELDGLAVHGVSEQSQQLFPLNAVYQAAIHGYADDLRDILILCDELTRSQMLEWTDEFGRTALIVATQLGNYECIKILLAEGANVNHMSTHRSGVTALHLAVFLHRSKKIVHQLLLHGADPFVENFGGVTPWDVSLSNGNSSSLMFSNFALFEALLYIKVVSDTCVSEPVSKTFWVRIVPRHSHPDMYSGKQRIGMRLCIHWRVYSDTVCEVDLEKCNVSLLPSTTNESDLCDLRFTCPSSSLLSYNEKRIGRISDGRNATLMLRGPREFLKGFIDIVSDQDLALCDRATFENEDDDCEDPSSLQSDIDDSCEESSLSDGSLSPSSPMALSNMESEVRWPHGLGGSASLTFFKPRHGTAAGDCCGHGRVVVAKEEGMGQQDDGTTNEGELCVICLDRPKTVGLVHGKSMHVCACEECAEKLSSGSNRCPLCREIIQHIVTKIF